MKLPDSCLSIFATLLCILCYCNSYGQLEAIIDSAKISEYLQKKRFDIDTGADAVILFEKSTIEIKRVRAYDYAEIRIQRIAKVISQNVPTLTEVYIPYTGDIKIKKAYAASYNIEQGTVIKTELAKEDKIKEKIIDGINQLKFQIPNVKSGSLVYLDILIRDNNFDYRQNLDWSFQGAYSCLHSEYELIAEDHFNYINTSPVIFDSVSEKEQLNTKENAYYTTLTKKEAGFETLRIKHQIWALNNVPVYSNEPFVLNPAANFPTLKLKNIENISLQASAIEWPEANAIIYNTPEIQGLYNYNYDTISKKTKEIIGSETDTFKMARHVYNFVRDSFTCTRRINRPSNPYNTFLQRKGITKEINIALAAMLKSINIKAVPVLVSTRENGKLNEKYFTPQSSDYLVLACVLNNSVYYLDASSKFLKFGDLLPKCYNGFCWGITEKGVPLSIDDNSLADQTYFKVDLTPISDSVFNYSMKLKIDLGRCEAIIFKQAYQNDSSGCIQSLKDSMNYTSFPSGGLVYKLRNLDNPDSAVSIEIDLNIKLPLDDDVNYIESIYKKFFETNPFAPVERKNPVEFGHLFQKTYNLHLTLPPNYILDEIHRPVKFSLPGNSIVYVSTLKVKEKDIFLTNVLKSNKATFSPKEYSALRDIVSDIITDQAKKLTIIKQ